MYLHTEFHVPSCNGALSVAINTKAHTEFVQSQYNHFTFCRKISLTTTANPRNISEPYTGDNACTVVILVSLILGN